LAEEETVEDVRNVEGGTKWAWNAHGLWTLLAHIAKGKATPGEVAATSAGGRAGDPKYSVGETKRTRG
jgi:hypothetical protein